MDIATRLRGVIESRGLKQSRVAALADLPEETLSRILNGVTKNPGVYTLAKIVYALDLTVGWLLNEKGYELSGDDRADLKRLISMSERLLQATQQESSEPESPNASAVKLGRRPPLRIPRRGTPVPVSATDWRESFGDRHEDVDIEIPDQFAERGATLVFRAEGESMSGEFIAHRDLLYVREEPDPKAARGKIVVCVVAGSPYVKRLDFSGNRVRLLSANDKFPPMLFHEQTVDWSLVGVVVGWSHEAG